MTLHPLSMAPMVKLSGGILLLLAKLVLPQFFAPRLAVLKMKGMVH
jgi:hypothetical protein